MSYNFLLTFNEAVKHTIYLISEKNLNQTKPNCIFLANARIPHERGDRLRQIGPIGLRTALPARIRTTERPARSLVTKQPTPGI